MDIKKLNLLIEKACIISQHIRANGRDPLLEESLTEIIMQIKVRYGDFLSEKLFDFYEDYFEDNEMESLENYLLNEVSVFGDELDQETLIIGIQPSPLRIEVYNKDNNYQHVLWLAA